MELKAVVCGGRSYADREFLFARLDEIGPTSVAHGGADGADGLCGEWAEERGVPCRVYRANWVKHGLSAGPIRNQEMLDAERPDVVVAFPGGSGTADTVRRATRSGTRVVDYR